MYLEGTVLQTTSVVLPNFHSSYAMVEYSGYQDLESKTLLWQKLAQPGLDYRIWFCGLEELVVLFIYFETSSHCVALDGLKHACRPG